MPYAEQLDPTTGRHLGNFTQALTHLSLITAVQHVIEAEQHSPSTTAARLKVGGTSADSSGNDRFVVAE